MAKIPEVRKVFAANLVSEFRLIDYVLCHYRFAALDTAFPGTVYQPQKPYYELDLGEKYETMRKNVNACKIKQLGLTLSDTLGNSIVWEFYFNELDQEKDLHNPSSIQQLRVAGIDFVETIKVDHFARCFLNSGLGASARSFFGIEEEVTPITWVFFHATYDLGYLIKALTKKDIPKKSTTFFLNIYIYLGFSIFDIKEMGKSLGLHGGLERVARNLEVSRQVGNAHQSGSDSLLTLQTFFKLCEKHCTGENSYLLQQFNHKLHGIEGFKDMDVLWKYQSYCFKYGKIPAIFRTSIKSEFAGCADNDVIG